MTLIDSSAWIEYYRPKGSRSIKELVYRAIEEDAAAINGIISVEVAGSSRPEAREVVEADFGALHEIPLTAAVYTKAVEVCGALRSTGIAVPATDAIIVASSLVSGARMIHVDTHFDTIAEHFPLSINGRS